MLPGLRTMSDLLVMKMQQFHMHHQHGSWCQQLHKHQSTRNNISIYTTNHSIRFAIETFEDQDYNLKFPGPKCEISSAILLRPPAKS
jgi:hypothetical protein